MLKNFWESGGGSERAPREGLVGTPTYVPQNDPHDAIFKKKNPFISSGLLAAKV